MLLFNIIALTAIHMLYLSKRFLMPVKQNSDGMLSRHESALISLFDLIVIPEQLLRMTK